MNVASINELRNELSVLPDKEIRDLCLRLARFKKENKELLSFLLFDSQDEEGYIENIKNYIDEEFSKIQKINLYQAKKSIRKILRVTNKYIKFIGKSTSSLELMIHFCFTFRNSGIPMKKSVALMNLYSSQLKKIDKVMIELHEDLQYDYRKRITELSTNI